MPRKIRVALLAVSLTLGGAAIASAADGQANVKLTREESRGAATDATNHFGDSPANPGPIADLNPDLTPAAVKAAMKLVADWQLGRAQKYFNQQWTFGTLDHGLLAASQSTGDPKYHDAMVAMAEQLHWDIQRPGQRNPDDGAAVDGFGGDDAPPPPPPPDPNVLRQIPLNANSECLAQAYLDLYEQYDDPRMIEPTRSALDATMGIDTYPATFPGQRPPARQGRGRGAATRPGDQGMDLANNPHHIIWWRCDALYMAPPAWAKLYKATGQTKYLAYMDHHWWTTSQYLYDPEEHLYFRDNSFIAKREANGKKMFWSRGNGWVMGGLARLLQDVPENYPTRAKYVEQFKEMAGRVAELQGPDGLWRAGMLDPDYYVLPENSGSAFFCYAMAWGVNQGLLDRATYEPVAARAWKGLLSHVHADGRLDCVQQTGSGPAHYKASSSYVYGVGAFLLAGREINRLAIAQSLQHLR